MFWSFELGHGGKIDFSKISQDLSVLVRYIEQGKAWHGASELVGAYQIQKEIELKKFMGGLPQLVPVFSLGYIIAV